MNRRQFLAGSALVSLTGSSSAAEARSIPLAFSLYGMKALPLSDALKACSEIGYDGIELACMPGYHGDPANFTRDQRREFRGLLRDLKLTLFALMENTPLDVADGVHEANLSRLRSAMQLAHELAADSPPIIETILGGKVDAWDHVRDRFATRLMDWVKLADREKATVCIKPHRFNACNRPEHLKWLLDRAGSERIRVAYDWSHFEERDLTLAGTLDALCPVSRFVHVKDTVLDKKGQARFVLPGQGTTSYADLIRGLSQRQYAGCVCVEVSSQVFNVKGYDPRQAAQSCYAVLSKAYLAANVKRR